MEGSQLLILPLTSRTVNGLFMSTANEYVFILVMLRKDDWGYVICHSRDILETDRGWGSMSSVQRVRPRRQKLMIPAIKCPNPSEIMVEGDKSSTIDNAI